MSNNEQTIQFPVALKPLLTDFVVNVLRERIPSDQLSSYAVQYFSERQNLKSYIPTNDDQEEQTGIFLTNQISGISQKSDDSTNNEKQRRKSVWGGSPDPDRDLTNKVVMKSPDVFEKLCKMVQDTVIYVGDDPSLVKQFVKYLTPKNVIQNEEIIRQGDEGDYFYCIESGKYDVLVNGKKVSELDNKGCFGEIALLYSQPRTATVIAKTDGKLWLIDRDTFSTLTVSFAIKQREKYLKFLHTVNFIQIFYSRGWLNENRLEDLADALRPRYYLTNQIIIEQGDIDAYEMFFIENGSVKVTRKEKDGTIRELKILGTGKCFGELALLENKPRYATVTALEKCRLATLDATSFENLLGIELKTKLKEFIDKEYATGTLDDNTSQIKK
ncbi:unnamed protein product [Adineta steineri]|uniref:Cyclic nucleotide-binding domain-containing protein n=1 Tax=Adineta steineri TaxID=433720 RepID=A0A814TMF8_9BILA|nr:unnamed protein product [Adineta steineri]CAF3975347.1 unnamed protein product [Adineta steineri]